MKNGQKKSDRFSIYTKIKIKKNEFLCNTTNEFEKSICTIMIEYD